MTKRRTWPLSKMRELMPAYFWPRLSSADYTVMPVTSTTVCPSVCCRMGVGM